MSEEKPTFPRELVLDVFAELLRALDPSPAFAPKHCPNAFAQRVCGVGGMRRRKAAMKDLEILFVPQTIQETDPLDMFKATHPVDVTEREIARLVSAGILEPRLSETGHQTWGRWNKLARHVPSGLPIDLFCATEENYFNRMVVTTGPKEVNILIAERAHDRGYDWKVAEAGFVPRGTKWEGNSKRVNMRSERAVFEFVNLPCLPPWERNAETLKQLAA